MQGHLILAIGLFAQTLFGVRMLIQWVQSERERRVVSSQVFWKTSLLASAMLLIYGLFRHDAVIVVGQVLSYYIYIRNLHHMGEWKPFSLTARVSFLILPLLILLLALFHEDFSFNFFLQRNAFTHWLIIVGWTGQILLNLRFVYQIYVAEKAREAVLPRGFWMISLLGSLMILMYALYRTDVVLLVGQLFGIFVYSRNILLDREASKVTS